MTAGVCKHDLKVVVMMLEIVNKRVEDPFLHAHETANKLESERRYLDVLSGWFGALV